MLVHDDDDVITILACFNLSTNQPILLDTPISVVVDILLQLLFSRVFWFGL